MKEMNVCYQNQGDYQLPYITYVNDGLDLEIQMNY